MADTVRQLKKDKRTKLKRQQDFLEAFMEHVSITRAAKKARIYRTQLYDWLKENDDEFKKAYQAACDIAVQRLEDEAVRRAFEGINKPVYQGGEKIGTIKEYSDTLLIFLLKGKAPEKYKERYQQEHTGKDGKEIQIVHVVKSNVDYSKLPDNMLENIIDAKKSD